MHRTVGLRPIGIREIALPLYEATHEGHNEVYLLRVCDCGLARICKLTHYEKEGLVYRVYANHADLSSYAGGTLVEECRLLMWRDGLDLLPCGEEPSTTRRWLRFGRSRLI